MLRRLAKVLAILVVYGALWAKAKPQGKKPAAKAKPWDLDAGGDKDVEYLKKGPLKLSAGYRDEAPPRKMTRKLRKFPKHDSYLGAKSSKKGQQAQRPRRARPGFNKRRKVRSE